jgi:ABC-2 type transport system permease protein
MKKILRVAQREFVATAGTKAFIFAMLIVPAIFGVLILIMPRLINEAPPKIEGQVAVVDVSGQVAGGVRDYLQPDRIARRRQEEYRRMQEAMPAALRSTAAAGGRTQQAVDDAFQKALGEVPRLEIVVLGPGTDLEAAKAPLKDTPGKDHTGGGRLALVVVHRDAVTRDQGKPAFGTYDLFVRGKLDDRIVDEIRDSVRESIVAQRIRLSGMDRAEINALTAVGRVRATAVTAEGEGSANEMLNMFIPMAFMALLLMSVLMSGQYLLTTTVEEKSNRVVEVLLSAVSPMQLMAGKVLGQMGVGFLILSLYLGLGLMGMFSFAMLGLIDPKLILFLFLFFLLAYATVGAFMAAIGSAVNEMREAQAFMSPLMLVMMIPWILWMPISRDPNSVFATVLSFIPPLSNFVMMLRMSSTNPPPLWQPVLGVVVSAAGAVAALWLAGKIFRIGLLMYGKPPNFATLIRWARQG